MRFLPLLLLAWLALSFEIGLKDSIALGPGLAPSFVLILSTWVALGATPSFARWTAIGLGAAMDLAAARPLADGATVVILGPYALGFLLAAQFTLTLRGVMFRKSPYSLALLAALSGIVSGAIVVALLFVRSWYEPLDFHATADLFARGGAALYTGGAALILAPILLALNSTMGFHQVTYSARPTGRF